MVSIVNNPQVVETVRSRVLSLLSRRNNWRGTMTDLLNAIALRGRQPEVWPGSASSLRLVMNRLVPSIRKAGFKVQFSRTTDRERRRVVSFERVR